MGDLMGEEEGSGDNSSGIFSQFPESYSAGLGFTLPPFLSSPGPDDIYMGNFIGGVNTISETNLSRMCVNSTFYNSSEGLNCSTIYVHGSYERDRLFEFIVNGCGITIVALLGIVGNMLSGVVLSRPQMRSSVTCLLLGLAFCDSLLVFTSALLFGLYSLADFMGTLATYRLIYHPLWVPFLYPISISAQTASVYLTLAVTLERYVAVCHPLRARSLCTWRRARTCVITVFLFAIIYNLPRWWEVRTEEVFSPLYNTTIFENVMSQMRANDDYIKIYINWAYLLVMYMVPFSGLVAFNLAIYRQVRKANRERQVLSKLQRREMGLATMLLCVVVVFLMCNVLPLVNNILESFYNRTIDHLVQTSNFLVVFNSSVNFVIYCTCGERFRRLLLRLCRDFLWCRLGAGARNNTSRRNSLYRKSHLYRGQHGGGDAEDMSLGSVGTNHTCIATGNGANGSLIVIDKNRSIGNNGHKINNFRNKTIPVPQLGRHTHNHNNHMAADNVLQPNSHHPAGGLNLQIQSGGMQQQNGKLYKNRRISSPTP